MKAELLLRFVSRQLQDVEAVTWDRSTLLALLSDAQREIVRLHPSANAVHSVIRCQSGTLQQIPSDGVTFIRALRNVDAQGKVGAALSPAHLADMDALNAHWHSDTEQHIARQWFADPQDPRVFYVYPAIKQGSKLEIIYSVSPVEVESQEDVIGLPETYKPALQYYMLAAALSMETEGAEDSKALQYYALFEKSIKGGGA